MVSQKELRKKKVKVVGRTPEESEASRQKALEETGAREKAKKKAIDAGATTKEAGIAGASFTEAARAEKAIELQQGEELAVAEEKKVEDVGLAEEAGAFAPLPEKPIETIEGESERSSGEKLKDIYKNSGLGKAVNYVDTLGGLLSPEMQGEIIRQESKTQIIEEIDEEINKVNDELDAQFVEMGFGGLVGAGLVGGLVSESGATDFFSSEAKVSNLKGSIEALNQMSTTISTAVNDNSIDGRAGLKAMTNIRKILLLRRQQIKEVAIGSPSIRIKDTLIEIDTDLFEAETENQLELNNVANALIEGRAEPSEAQILITKRRVDKQKNG